MEALSRRLRPIPLLRSDPLLATPLEVDAALNGRFHHVASRPRPLVLVDMDGPLAGFDQAFYTLCIDQGWAIDVTPEGQTERWYTAHMPDPRERALAREYVNTEPGWFRNLPVVPGAITGMETLTEVAEVFICTKPLETNPTCRDDKAAWLAEHFGEAWLERLIITPDKSVVRGDILLDDALKPEWYSRAEWEPVVFATPFNGAGSIWGDLRRWDWSQPVEDLVRPYLREPGT